MHSTQQQSIAGLRRSVLLREPGSSIPNSLVERASVIVNAIVRLHMYEDRSISNGAQEHPSIFAARFARCRGLLRFIASRVLGSNEEAENALQSCWLTASCNPPKFEYEGAFRSWLLRILIDEALIILREKEQSTSDGNAGNRHNY
jgi:hypothetical protein